jgi:hypothetical protein
MSNCIRISKGIQSLEVCKTDTQFPILKWFNENTIINEVKLTLFKTAY